MIRLKGELIGRLFMILRFLKANIQLPLLYTRTNGVPKILYGALKNTLRLRVTPEEKAVTGYFEQIYPFPSPKAILIFDDICWSRGRENARKTIKRDERVKVSVDLEALGICLIDCDFDKKECFRIPIG